ncbi:MAG: glutaredoxin family protein [Xanthomonadales bacterium]|nr:glutaredoxin family protein [Xanthomonadales bacterium]
MTEPRTGATLVLYVTDDCGLCDRAVDVLAQVRAPDFECIGIDGDRGLEARYGVRVPVLVDAVDGRELGWPFDAAAVASFLALR